MLSFYNKILIFFIICFSLLIIILIISQIECNSYKLNIFNIKNEKNSDKLKLIFITDFHNKVFKNSYEKLISDILSVNADYIVLGGDFINFSGFQSKKNSLGIENTYAFLTLLLNKIHENKNYNLKRIFFAFGNHELRLKNRTDSLYLTEEYNKFINFLKTNNIYILDNDSYKVSNGITLYGLSLYDGYYGKIFTKKLKFKHIDKKVFDETFKNINQDNYNIMVFHKPDYAEDFIDYGFDLVLSGHYHGGLVNFPIVGPILSPDFKIFPKYSVGHYKYKNGDIIVSSGLGEHLFKIRVNNIPEVVVININ